MEIKSERIVSLALKKAADILDGGTEKLSLQDAGAILHSDLQSDWAHPQDMNNKYILATRVAIEAVLHYLEAL